ncbi:uncharacterized [Tachysurus ichikawai]
MHWDLPQLAPGSKANHTSLINLLGREDESFWVLCVGRAGSAWCPNEMGVNWPEPGSITNSCEGACTDRVLLRPPAFLDPPLPTGSSDLSEALSPTPGCRRPLPGRPQQDNGYDDTPGKG